MPDIVFSVTSRRFFDQSAFMTFGQTLIARLMTRNLIFYLFGNQCVSTASFLNSETCLLTKMLPHHTFKMKPNLWIQPHFYHAAIERFLKQFRSKIVSVTEWLIGNTCNFLARLLISFMHDSLSAMIIWSKKLQNCRILSWWAVAWPKCFLFSISCLFQICKISIQTAITPSGKLLSVTACEQSTNKPRQWILV